MDQADDLKAFERRMIEIVSSLQPSIWRWRFILTILVLFTLITFCSLISSLSFFSSYLFSSSSSSTISSAISSTASLDDKNATEFHISILLAKLFRKEITFSITFAFLIFAFLFGIHRKMFASSIIIARFRYVLADYNMSCDSDGRLIIKPRPAAFYNG